MKKEIKELKEELFYNQTKFKSKERKDDEKFKEIVNEYKEFLNRARIEREGISELVKLAKQKGFLEFDKNKEYKSGDKVYKINRGKNIILTIIGKKPINEGINIIAAHLDSPRLDLKPNPLYESENLAYFKTHYYGGIKKYQWASIPLALHGVIINKEGEKIEINIGENEDDPIFSVNDLLPHLATEQMKRSSKDLIKGEELNVLVGSDKYKDDNDNKKEKDLIKLNVLKILNDKYKITERDFISAELSLTPAYKTKDAGIDRSLLAGYGHDDKVCSYAAAKSILDISSPSKTIMAVLIDKEEIGSDGNTGMKSSFFEYTIEELADKLKGDKKEILTNSSCLSADVTAAYDPNYPDVIDKKNGAYGGHGISISKYTGAGGKSSTSDASAEFLDKVTRLYDKNNILWQICELGKVDMGGGGTIAKYLANLNMEVLDVGVAVYAMHSPLELITKFDLFELYKGYYAFYKEN